MNFSNWTFLINILLGIPFWMLLMDLEPKKHFIMHKASTIHPLVLHQNLWWLLNGNVSRNSSDKIDDVLLIELLLNVWMDDFNKSYNHSRKKRHKQMNSTENEWKWWCKWKNLQQIQVKLICDWISIDEIPSIIIFIKIAFAFGGLTSIKI